MIAPMIGSGIWRKIRTHPRMDKHLFGSSARDLKRIFKYLKYLSLRCPETRHRIPPLERLPAMNYEFRALHENALRYSFPPSLQGKRMIK
ncbi:MAG TPA: hypothetical protein VGE85_01595 [Terracidiphilus sp.]|jgi:hypothetical protein